MKIGSPTFFPFIPAPINRVPEKSVTRPILKSEPVAQASPAFPSGLLKVYFGKLQANPAPSDQPLEPLAGKAVDWFDKNVETIPPLERVSRKNHRVHLRMIGEVLGLLPPAHSALEGYQQYATAFNALEAKVAPGKKDYRMYCHDKVPTAGPKDYIARHYGFYILVFAPNGAIESFRHNTPPVVDIDGKNKTDFSTRMKFFNATGADFDRLQDLLKGNNHRLFSIPPFLQDTHTYARSVFKLGANGQDAWNQVYPVAQQMYRRKKEFETWVREATG